MLRTWLDYNDCMRSSRCHLRGEEKLLEGLCGRQSNRKTASLPVFWHPEPVVNSSEQIDIETQSYEPGFGMAVSKVLCDITSGCILDR